MPVVIAWNSCPKFISGVWLEHDCGVTPNAFYGRRRLSWHRMHCAGKTRVPHWAQDPWHTFGIHLGVEHACTALRCSAQDKRRP